MKKFFIISTLVAMSIGCVGCGGSNNTATTPNNTTQNEAQNTIGNGTVTTPNASDVIGIADGVSNNVTNDVTNNAQNTIGNGTVTTPNASDATGIADGVSNNVANANTQ